LFAGLVATAPALAAETGRDDAGPAVPESNHPSWFSRWFSFGSKKSDNKPAEHPADEAKEHPAVNEVDQIAAQRQREELALMRRLDVCDKLQEIASQTGDESLLAEAQKLAEDAGRVYDQHMARFVAGGAPVKSHASTGDKQNELTAAAERRP
jgi:hypothetical protein